MEDTKVVIRGVNQRSTDHVKSKGINYDLQHTAQKTTDRDI